MDVARAATFLVERRVALDLDRVVEALARLEPVARFLEIVRASDAER